MIVLNYINKNSSYIEKYKPNMEFKTTSYSNWAAYEILNILMDHPFDSEDYVFELIMKFEYCSRIGKDENKLLFSQASKTAEHLYTLIF